MKSLKNLLVILSALLISFSPTNFSFAATSIVKKTTAPKPAPSPIVKKQVTQTGTPKEQTTAEVKSGLCDCLKGAIDSIQKAYASLEEDEWPTAIKITKDTISTISAISKTCACPETIAYEKIAEAYLKYAEGGNHLDGAEEPNCPYATKLYSDAITLLETYIPKITNPAVKGNSEDIKEYVKEEKEFVDEECGQSQSQEKSKGAGEIKEKKQ